jgi:NO-binding membrane sensor protein with MHYT domain
MVRVLGCVVEQHDLWLVGVACVICVLCWAGALLVMERAVGASKENSHGWLALAAVAAGGGTWATHFVGMLAYQPGIPIGFDLPITLWSAVVGLVGAFLAFEVFARWRSGLGALGAGLIMGAAVAGLHFVGMTGVEAAATPTWALDLVIATASFAAMFTVLGFAVLARARSFAARAGAGALFIVGVLSMHFTGVGALTLTPDPLLAQPAHTLDHTGLAIMVTVGAAALLVAAAAFSFADRRIQAAKLAAAARMSRLADAAIEGLLIHDAERIVDANSNIAAMVNCTVDELIGRTLREFVAPASLPALQAAARGERPYPVEATLISPKGLVEVEIHRRVLNAAEGLYVSAVRDIALRRRAERAERAESAKSQFLANMSLEVRGPLNAIIASSARAMAATREPETGAEIGRIHASATQLLTVLNEALDLSKRDGAPGQAAPSLPPRPTQLKAVS